MTFAMLRKCLTAAVALAALAAALPMAPSSTAEARPAASPFEGTYSWITGTYYGNTWAVTISERGQISGVLVASYGYTKGSFSGRVNEDGTYSFVMSLTYPIFDDGERGHHGGPKSHTERTTYSGILAADVDGNLVGTPDVGGSFTWVRQ